MPSNLNNLKSKVDKPDVDKLVPVPVDLSKLSDVVSSVKWSDAEHFLKAQGKFIFSFPCTLFYIFLTPKNYKLSL